MPRPASSLRTKVLLPLLAGLTAALGLIAVLHHFSYRKDLSGRLREKGARIANTIQFIAGSRADPPELQRIVSAFTGEPDVNQITVLAGEPLRVVASSQIALRGRPLPPLLADEAAQLRKTLEKSAPTFDAPDGEFEVDYYHPLQVASAGAAGHRLEPGVVMVHLDRRRLEQEVFEIATRTVGGYGAAVLLMALSCWLLLRRHVLAPVAGIGAAVARFSGDPAARIAGAAGFPAELAGLAGMWNEFADRLAGEAAERRRTEAEKNQLLAEIKAHRQRLTDLLESVPGIVWEAWGRPDAPDQRFHFISDYVMRLLGYRVEEWLVTPRFWLGIIHPEDLERSAREMVAMYDSGVAGTAQFRLRHKDGHAVWTETHTIVVHDETGAPVGMRGVTLDITARKQVEAALEEAHRGLIGISRQAGMAEVATSVLHNVGNVLNSVNISADLLAEQVRKSPVGDLGRVVALLQEHEGNLGAFFAQDPRGPKLPEFLAQLAGHFTRVQETQLKEVTSLQKNVEHIKEIVAMQQSYARVAGVTESLQVTDLVEDALRMNGGSFQRHAVQVAREFAPGLPAVLTEKHKVLQILVNLLSNAKYACDGAAGGGKRITVRVAPVGSRLRVQVIDTGVGIAAENLDRIFSHGFTTKKDGHGFGLHGAANAAKELGGALTVQSAGLGCGATFTLELPCPAEEVAHA